MSRIDISPEEEYSNDLNKAIFSKDTTLEERWELSRSLYQRYIYKSTFEISFAVFTIGVLVGFLGAILLTEVIK